MRLLQLDDSGRYGLTAYLASNEVPPYAILSHTWGADEVTFTDLEKPNGEWHGKAGFQKIKFIAEQAKRHALQYFWVDSCCIDKSNHREMETAINRMFQWYQNAKHCFVYLEDVSRNPSYDEKHNSTHWEAAFLKSRWFTRGWTLQELIAPASVLFFSREGNLLGDKQSLEPLIRSITGIPAGALRGTSLSSFSVPEREAWIRDRQTRYEEDMIYSLLGILNVNMSLIYGEGRERAETRLRKKVRKASKGTRSSEFSVTFSLSEVPDIQSFVAREEELAEMRKILKSDGSRRAVVLQGLGGIGKTQLAVAYAKRYRDEYTAVLWLNIKDESSISQSFTRVARQILQQHPDASRLCALDPGQDGEAVIEAVKAWLSLPENTQWLLVYDNYDNPKLAERSDDAAIDINRYLPVAYQGSIIVTTRLSQVDVGHQIRIKKLESTENSLMILSATSGRDGLNEDADAKCLVEALDGLPLAIATAGAYLRRVEVSPRDYLRLYNESWTRLHTSMVSLGSYQDRTLCSTWQISYEEVRTRNPLAAHLLQWWAYFDNEDLWFELFQHNGSRAAPTWIRELHDELNFHGAIGTLHDYGFVEPHTSVAEPIGSRGYSIHSCLHLWTIHVLNDDQDDHLSQLAVECVASRVPSQHEHQFWLLERRLLPHAMKAFAAIRGCRDDVSCALHTLGQLCAHQGKWRSSEEIFKFALREKIKAYGPDHDSTLDTVYRLGVLQANQGKPWEAEEMYSRVLKARETASQPDCVVVLETFHSLGNLYTSLGKLKEAEDMYLRSLQGKERLWGPDNTSTLDTVNNLGTLYATQGRLQEAETTIMRALRGKERQWGPNHSSTTVTIHCLGKFYADQGKLQQAEEMYLRALEGYQLALGPPMMINWRPQILLKRDYADLLWAQDRLLEAKEMYTEAYVGFQALYEYSHTEVRLAKEKLQIVCKALRSESGAENSASSPNANTLNEERKPKSIQAIKKVFRIFKEKRDAD